LLSISLEDRKDRKGDGKIRFISVEFENEKGENVPYFYSGQNIRIILCFKNNTQQTLKNLNVALGIDNQIGERITNLSTEVRGSNLEEVKADVHSIILELNKLPLTPGRYGFTIFSTVNGIVSDWIANAGFFEVEGGDFYGTGKLPPAMQGNFLLDYNFYVKSTVLNK
ncbi:MAG: Wzt carbohydrate-binding domain-containing protein, partial [Dolichospermum sp.]